jgi:hypothetical protein
MAQTKSDKSRQPAFRPLSVTQLTAIDALITGKTDAEAAEAAGVTRPTVTDWRNHHPVFMATLNERRSAPWSEAHDRLRAMGQSGRLPVLPTRTSSSVRWPKRKRHGRAWSPTSWTISYSSWMATRPGPGASKHSRRTCGRTISRRVMSHEHGGES